MRVTVVTGMAQQGKTQLALELARTRGKRVLVLDPAKAKTLQSVATVTSWVELARLLSTRSDRWEVALRTRHFADYVATLKAAPFYRHVVLLVDELLTFTGDSEACEALVAIARTSAHYGEGTGLDVIFTTQRPKDIPTDIRSQTTLLYSFAQREPADRDWISKFACPEFADEVAGLAPHCHAHFPPTQEEPNEGVLHGGSRRGFADGDFPSRPEDQPHPAHSSDSRAEVAGARGE